MDDIFETADDLFESNPKKALALYSQAVEEFPEDVRGYVGLARCFYSLNQLDKAVENAEKALEIDSFSVKAYHVLTYVSILRKEKEKGFLNAEKAYSLDPDSYRSLVNFGVVNIEIKNYEKSAELFEKALKLQPENSALRQTLIAVYLQLKKWDEAQLELNTLQKKPFSVEQLVLRIGSSLRIQYKPLENFMKGIAIVGMPIILLGAILFRNRLLFILSEIFLLLSIMITIKRREIGKINKIGIIIFFVFLMVEIARVVVFQ
jgi:tetratricopeptide (TPR) repeat protein